MIHPMLQQKLATVFQRQRRLRLALYLALCWGVLAMLGLGIIFLRLPGAAASPLWILLLLLLGAIGVGGVVWHRKKEPDWHDLAGQIEKAHPELNGLLLTAVQQQPMSDGQLHYLQQRVVREALQHSHMNSWSAVVPWPRIAAAQFAHLLALVLFLCVLVGLWPGGQGKNIVGGGGWTADGVTITPGDISIERGERLVVVASFDGSVPANAELLTTAASEQPKRIPLVKSLSDPVFGGSISEVNTNLVYHVEYGGKRTRDFTVTVFEFPRLERADVDLTYPDYTGLAPKRIENTRRVSAVEGSRGNVTLQLNKPVASAQFVVKGETNGAIPLIVATNSPVVTLVGLPFETNRTYMLQLVDTEGRTNKLPAQFVLDVLKNREPELKIASPRGDTRPSALEEVSFEGMVWDDFGVQAYGLAYAEAGSEIKFVELGLTIPAGEKRPFKHVLHLEDLGAKPDQLISWFLWADDIGPDGQVRRSAGDMYFAEVRSFDEVFRQGQGGAGGGEQQQAGGESGGGGSPQAKLAELQKQIINATWKLQRQQSRQSPAPTQTKPASPSKSSEESSVIEIPNQLRRVLTRAAFGQRAPNSSETPLGRARANLSGMSGTNKTVSASQFAEDLTVVRDAVTQALSLAQAEREKQSGVRSSALWDDVIRDMERAGAALDKAAKSPQSLGEALAAQQSAFQALLKLQQREFQISRNQNRSQQSSGRDQQSQRQLDQLDLTQPENRYENERLAQPPQSAERREQLQVMNRLGELARRQQDLNERLAELQTALQEAKTEQEREEIRRQLKRLEEEEQRMLADADELQQRMNQPENQSRMSEQRQQLEEARQEMQRAAEATQQGQASQALASGTRAQRQLQEARENMRKQNSSEFAEDLKQLRSEAREAERQQQEIQKQMDSLADAGQKTLDDSQERQKSLEQLAQQTQRLTNLVERATQLSQQTEEAEPLASRELYDSLRKFSQEDAKSLREFQDELIQRGLIRTELYRRLTQMQKEDGVKSVELTSEMVRQGLLPQAQQASDRTGSAVSDLKRGIERAAEKVLGDDTEALRLAQQQLEKLSEQIEREIAQGQGLADTNRNQRSADSLVRESQQAGQELADSAVRAPGESANRNPEATSGESSPPQSGSRPSENGQAASEQNGQGRPTASAQNRRGNRGPREGEPRGGGSGVRDLPPGLEQFLDAGRGGNGGGAVITGEDFVPWADGLREVEEMVEDSSQQNRLATARERARVMRQEYKRTGEKPDWAVIRSQVVKPLVEVRSQIAEELARRGPRENLVPIDRDPVPSRYSESVRRYYEELGKDK